ncbi:hypothetical protein [Agrobacterium vitis]|uniref:Uncharacterized protein n=1 Tax=Agrobacterium vitis TaxID=373 RepID=A0A7K1RN33_AGRVI|nr:hypothetical protein [Agrobacterium vitis]MVA59453.1 hypothetical protein [Agrobacterium vitis]
MLFNIDTDMGNTVGGWLVLDNPSDIPVFRFSVSGRQDLIFKSNVFRRDLQDIGIHTTGMAGFHIDEQIVPDLSSLSEFVLREATTGLPLYARYNPDRHLAQKLIIIDTGLLPQMRSMHLLMDFFAIRYPMIERFSLETVSSVLGRNFFQSVVVSGDVNWIRLSDTIEKSGFKAITLLRDPFEEMAEKFIFLKRIADHPPSASSMPLIEKYNVLLPLVKDMDFGNPKSVLSSLRGLTREQRRLLRSPVTYAFGASPDEELQRRNVSIALDNLAKLNLVGIRPRFEQYVASASYLLGAPIFAGVELKFLPFTGDLAATLAGIGIACDLLDEDIALYSFVREAVEAAIENNFNVQPSEDVIRGGIA